MLTYEDKPSIKYGIEKRLGKESGVSVLEILVTKHRACITVGVLYIVDAHDDQKLIMRSTFDLPLEFYLKQVHNQIDEMCEQVKFARKDYGITRCLYQKEKPVPGTGRRGAWLIN